MNKYLAWVGRIPVPMGAGDTPEAAADDAVAGYEWMCEALNCTSSFAQQEELRAALIIKENKDVSGS